MDDRFFNEIEVRHEMGKLRGLLRAIPKWEEVAVAEVDALAATDLSEMSEEQRHWHDEYVNDGYYGIDQTKEALYRGFAVSAASAVENIMGLFCGEHSVALRERPNWKQKREGLERLIGNGMDINALAGFDLANRARVLANCFKHSGGTVSQEYVDHIGPRALGEEIRYQDENWSAVIEGIQAALLVVAQRLPSGAGLGLAIDWRNKEPDSGLPRSSVQ
jgi:hypothetical protein